MRCDSFTTTRARVRFHGAVSQCSHVACRRLFALHGGRLRRKPRVHIGLGFSHLPFAWTEAGAAPDSGLREPTFVLSLVLKLHFAGPLLLKLCFFSPRKRACRHKSCM